jgi:glycerol-3-phosphate dehydrogenase (NAD(P)+)
VPTFAVLGAGMMGTAFCVPLADRGHRVQLVGTHLDYEIIEQLQRSRIHPTLGVEIPAPIEIHPIDDLESAGLEADWFVLGVNSLGVSWAAEKLEPLLKPGSHVIFLTKGLASSGNELQILPEYFRHQLPGELGASLHLYAIGGPSIAGELARRCPTSVVLTSTSPEQYKRLATSLQTSYYRVHATDDMAGVEFCVALKNLYSIAVGIAQAQGEIYGRSTSSFHNPAAAVYAQALAEIIYLSQQHSGRVETATWLAGAGDLYVTCQGGRNSRLGRYLAQGKSLGIVREELMEGETVEGYEVALSIGAALRDQLQNGRLDATRLPLLLFLFDVLLNGGPPEIPWPDFGGFLK